MVCCADPSNVAYAIPHAEVPAREAPREPGGRNRRADGLAQPLSVQVRRQEAAAERRDGRADDPGRVAALLQPPCVPLLPRYSNILIILYTFHTGYHLLYRAESKYVRSYSPTLTH